MRETNLDYGFFDSPQVKKLQKSELLPEEQKASESDNQYKIVESSSNTVQAAVTDSRDASRSSRADLKDSRSSRAAKNKSEKKTGRKTSIGAKLILIISTLVIISMGLITGLVSYFVTADTRANAEISNFTLNARTASDCESRINSVIASVSLFTDWFSRELTDEEFELGAVKYFDKYEDVAAIGFLSRDKTFINRAMFASKNIPHDAAAAYFSTASSLVMDAKNGIMHVENASPYFLNPMIAVFYPVQFENGVEVVAAVFSVEQLSESISTGKINESILVNDKGIVLLHSDSNMMMQAADLSDNEFIKNVIANNSTGMQQSYVDKDGEEYFAACKKITDGNCRVITQVKTSTVLAAINATTRRNLALTVAILSIAVLIIWIFAKTLSVPLKNLTAVTDEINKGNFNTELFDKLNVRRTDEIGVLNRSTKDERDILNTVTSLTNKGVTKAIVRKEIDFEPHLKDITIFFSDIRGFTAISDGFNKKFGDKSAAEIISFLNDYISRMINCISITGGVVDKFEGDAIMAAWGVLRDDNLEYETLDDSDPNKIEQKKLHEEHIKSDAISAITSAVAMRYALMKYNKDAELFTKEHKDEPLAPYKPHIRIGAGLNSGRATVGFMGSTEKMEFTSIGDAVNLASRTESSNKPCGTDILITEDTYNLLKHDFIRCKENNFTIRDENLESEVIVEVIPVTFEVKGKGKQHFYGVVNMPNFNIEKFFKNAESDFVVDPDCQKALGPDGPKTLAQVRKLLGIPTPDFGKVNLNEEENKVKAN